jgi:PIN domain nuclease of toxin-antitoxin system
MALVLDTHAVIWYLSGSKQLSPTARTVIGSAEQNAEDIFISAISLVEVIYLAEKGRLPSVALQRLQDALKDPVGSMIVAPLDAAVAEAVQRIPRETVPDMPDRIIAATAAHLDAELVTRDRRLHFAGILKTAGIRIVW